MSMPSIYDHYRNVLANLRGYVESFEPSKTRDKAEKHLYELRLKVERLVSLEKAAIAEQEKERAVE